MLAARSRISFEVRGYKLDAVVMSVNEADKGVELLIISGPSFPNCIIKGHLSDLEAVVITEQLPASLIRWTKKPLVSLMMYEKAELLHALENTNSYVLGVAQTFSSSKRSILKATATKYMKSIDAFLADPSSALRRESMLRHRFGYMRKKVLPHQLQLTRKTRKKLQEKTQMRNNNNKFSKNQTTTVYLTGPSFVHKMSQLRARVGPLAAKRRKRTPYSPEKQYGVTFSVSAEEIQGLPTLAKAKQKEKKKQKKIPF